MKGKSTKSALLMSFTSLLLCFAMLIGCTFAWFTDSVTSGVNKIQAGNLDIEVEYSKTGAENSWQNLQGSESLFSSDKWEPGHTEYVTLKVINKGTLALNYKLNVSPVSESGGINMAGQSFKLSDYLVFKTTNAATTAPTYANRQAARDAATGAEMKLNQTNLSKGGVLYPQGDSTGPNAQYITLVVYMPETVGNEANYKTGTEAPQINLGITVVATQKEHEVDSFGPDYDGGADTDPSYTESTDPTYAESVVETLTKTVVADSNTVFESSLTPSQVEGNKTTITFPKEIKELTPESTAELEVEVTPTIAANMGFKIASEGAVGAISLDVTVDGNPVTEFKDETGNPRLVKIETYVAKNLTEVSLTYGDSETWTQVDNEEDVHAEHEFYYDFATGKLVYLTKHFSTFLLGAAEVAYIESTNTAYLTIDQAFEAATAEDGAVTLLKDITLSHYVYTGLCSVFDLNGKTVTANVANSSLHFSSANDSAAVTATMKNGTYQQPGEIYGSGSCGRIVAFDGSNVTFSDMIFKSTNDYCCNAIAPFASNQGGAADITNTYLFKNCKFINANAKFDGAYGSKNLFNVTFDGCTFDAVNTTANGLSLIWMGDYNYGDLVIKNTTMTYSSNPSGAAGYCVEVGTYLDYTGMIPLNLKFENSTLNTISEAKPFGYKFQKFAATSYTPTPNAVVTEVGTNTYNVGGTSMRPIVNNNELTWMVAERAVAVEAAQAEWTLFKNTSGSGYSYSDSFVVQYNGISFVNPASNQNLLDEDKSIAPHREGFFCYRNANTNYYTKLGATDLSASLEGHDPDVLIYKLETAYSVTLTDGTNSNVVDVVAKNAAYQYQLPAEFAAKNCKYVSTTGGTISDTGLVSIPENKITSGVTITCYDGYQISATGASSVSIYTTGSAGSKFPSYNKNATALKLQVSMAGLPTAYSLSSITVDGKELDSSLYTVTTKPTNKYYDVEFNKAALTGDIAITVAENPLYTEYKAVYDTLGDRKNTYSYLITDGTNYTIGYRGMIAGSGDVSIAGTKATLTAHYNNDGTGTMNLTSPYNYEIGNDDFSASVTGNDSNIKVYRLTNIYTIAINTYANNKWTLETTEESVKSGGTYVYTVPEGKTLNSIGLGNPGGYSLTENTHYTVSGSTVTIDTSTFANDANRADSYNIKISVK